MESIVTYNNSEAQAEGKKLAEGNEFFRELSSLMENKDFRNFFNKYMGTSLEMKCTAVYMRLYKEFKEKYKEITDEELDRYTVIYLLYKVMSDGKLRKGSIETCVKILEENNKTEFWSEFEQLMIKNKD